MREIVLDTETTGLSPQKGHRVIEIGCVELVNHIPTGQIWHHYLNPQRDVPQEAFAIHGLSTEFLTDKPMFADLADAFLEFIAGDKLIIHNAPFDLGFLNFELDTLGKSPIGHDIVTDTLMLARRKHASGQNSLDALCRRYGIDNSARDKHGALLDAELLAEVYLELIGGRQPHLTLLGAEKPVSGEQTARQSGAARKRPGPLAPRISAEDIQVHKDFTKSLGEENLWRRYQAE